MFEVFLKNKLFWKKKGQGEVVGLLVIVILLIFIGFIYVRFSLMGDSAGYDDVRENIEVHDILSSFLQLETGGERIQELIAECYYDSGGCKGLELRVDGVFDTIIKGDEDYRLIIVGEGVELIKMGGCTRGIVSRVPFTFEGVFYEGELTVCRKVELS